MHATPIPELVAQKTISIPHEPAAIMGFEGRNKVMGTPALILKREALPTDGPFVGIPSTARDTLEGTEAEVYVLEDKRVIAVTAAEFEDVSAPHTFDDWHGKRVTVEAFHGDDATVWDRKHVTVET